MSDTRPAHGPHYPIQQGATHAEVARRLIVHRDSIWHWVKAYNEGGIEALAMSQGGCPEGNPKWDPAIFDELVKEIDQGGRYWSVPLMQQWIKEHCQKDIPESTIWYHVTHLGYSHKSARPHPYPGDPAK